LSGKKDLLKKTAIKLFALQGFNATTTLEIATVAGVTEPVIYYHFKNKDGLFTEILIDIFEEYFSCLDSLDKNLTKQFDKIKNLIDFHFDFVDRFPDETYMITSSCPAKLRDSAHICAQKIESQRIHLTQYISNCLIKGINAGEFSAVPVAETTGIILAMVNAFLRRRSLKLDSIKELKKESVEFCRRSLIKKL
jgi:AcrR family transcriptional regulator